MKRTIAVIAALMLVPSTTLASSVRPGSSFKTKTRQPTCLVADEWEKCEVTVDETGVTHPIGKVTNVVQWTTEEKDFSYGGAAVGAVAGTGVGMMVGLGSCAFTGPLCLFTAPAIMSGGTTAGAGLGGKGTGKFFTIIGDDAQGERLILEFNHTSGKAVKKTSKLLLNTTKLAEGEVK